MKCQSLLSGKNKKNIICLSSAEFASRAVKVSITWRTTKVYLYDQSDYMSDQCVRVFI